MHDLDQARIDLICRNTNGVQPLRQVSAIPDGFQKNRSQIWRLSVKRAYEMHSTDLIQFDHRPGIGLYGAGSIRTKSFVVATSTGRRYVEFCKEACRLSNLSWHQNPYGDYESTGDTGYVSWQQEWVERRHRFKQALTEIVEEQNGKAIEP